MKRSFFSFALYKHHLRQTKIAGLFLTVLFTVLTAYTPVMILLNIHPGFVSAPALNGPFAALPFIAASILMLLPLRLQNQRASSDFYHALPVTKFSLTTSCFAASATWCAIVTVVPTVILLLMTGVPSLHWNSGQTIPYLLLQCGGSFVASLFVMAVILFAAALCGKTLSTLCTAAVLIAAPRMFAYTLSTLILNYCDVLPPDSGTALLDTISQNLLYGDYTNPATWIATLLKFLAVAVVAFWASSKRQSETAGRAALSPVLHVLFRTLLCVLFCLPAISELLYPNTYADTVIGVVQFYLLALVVYYLYELLTKRCGKALLKATLWLPLVVAINGAIIAGCLLGAHSINTYAPSSEEIDSVSLSRIVYRLNKDGYINEIGYGGSPNVVSVSHDNVFYNVTESYANSEAPQICLEDEESLRIISHALKRHLDVIHSSHTATIYTDSMRSLQSLSANGGIAYLVDVQIRDGWFTHDRRIALTSEELKHLVNQIKKETSLPPMIHSVFTYDLYQGCTFYNEDIGYGEPTPEWDENAPDRYFHIRDDDGTVWISLEHLVQARTQYDADLTVSVCITLTAEGEEALYQASLQNIGKPLHLCYGENVLYSPVAAQPIQRSEVVVYAREFQTPGAADSFAELINSLLDGRR